jgi:hypothetical protein
MDTRNRHIPSHIHHSDSSIIQTTAKRKSLISLKKEILNNA